MIMAVTAAVTTPAADSIEMVEAMSKPKNDKSRAQGEHQDRATATTAVTASDVSAGASPEKMGRKEYEREMERLHGELVAMQEWVKRSGAKIIIVFKGRDTAAVRAARSSGSPSG